MLASVDVDIVSDLIVEAILDLDTEDLATRAGPRRHGYVEPTDAAWQLLEEVIEPGSRTFAGEHASASIRPRPISRPR